MGNKNKKKTTGGDMFGSFSFVMVMTY